MFRDFALIVEKQGEQLDNIEYQVTTAGDYVAGGIVELDKANKYQKKKRNMMCCLFVLLLVILVSILIPVIANAANNA